MSRQVVLVRSALLWSILPLPLLISPVVKAENTTGQGPKAEPAFIPETLAVDDVEAGWTHGLKLQGGANMDSQKNVVGKESGFSSTFGLKLDSFITGRFSLSEWKNTLNVAEAIVRAQALSEYNSNRDELRFESLYVDFFRALPWVGAFGRAAIDTSLFDSYDLRPTARTYSISHADGTAEQVTTDRLHLSRPLRPLTRKETIGLLARPVEYESLTLEVRGGLGARQISANGQKVLGKERDGVVSVKELQDTTELGFETLATVSGLLIEKKFGYRLFAEALRPFEHTPKSDGKGRSAAQLTSTDVGGSVSLNWTSWSALVYEFRSKRDPLLVDQAQISQSLMATVAFETKNAR